MIDLSKYWGDWKAYFRKYHEQRDAGKEDVQVSLRSRVIHSSKEVDWHEVVKLTAKGQPSASSHLGKVIKACLAHGWEFKVGRSTYFSGDKLQENGIVKEGHEGEHVWVQAMKDHNFVTYSTEYCRVNGQHVPFKKLIEVLEEE